MSKTMLFRSAVILGVIALAAFGVYRIFELEPPARNKRPDALPPLVRVLDAQARDHALQVIAHGTVTAADRLQIRPQIGGQLLSLHPAFEPGGVIPAAEKLYQIDPTDYRFGVKAAEAAVAKARAEVQIEQGRRKVAAEELRLLEGSVSIDAASRSLALRAPQLRQVRAELLRAENELEVARTQLARTHASLPYDVVVLARDKVAGEILAARESIGSVARADRFWVELQVPAGLLGRLQVGAAVEVRNQGHLYPASITRLLAELSESSRLASVLAEVQDPLAKQPGNAAPPLLIGSYVEALIDSGVVRNALAVPRFVLQDNNRLWTVDTENRLQVKQVEPLHIASDKVYLSPLAPGERILLGSSSGLVPGSEVRVQESR